MTALEELNLQCNQLCKSGYGDDASGLDGLFDSAGKLRSSALKKLDIWGNWSCREHTDQLYALFEDGSLELGFTYSCIKGYVKPVIKYDDDNVGYVTYDDFGVYRDGERDDFNAMRNAHRFANAEGCEVRAVPIAGKPYHIFRLYDLEWHPVYTNVDWQGADFVVHDENIDGYASRSVPLLCLSPSPAGAKTDTAAHSDIVTIPNPPKENPSESEQAKCDERPYQYAQALTLNKPFAFGKSSTSIAGLSPEVDTALAALNKKGYSRYYVQVYDEGTRHYRRFGSGGYSSAAWDGVIVNGSGAIQAFDSSGEAEADPAPVQWDFNALTKVVITPIPAWQPGQPAQVYIRNGNFVTNPLASKTEVPYNRSGNKPIYYLRNLQMQDCGGLEIANIHQTVGTKAGGFDNDNLSGSYTGFFQVRGCADVRMHDCSVWARRYDEGGRSTYGISFDRNVNISLTNVNCSNPWEHLIEVGGRRWGVTGTNHDKHILFDHCTVNRIDAHEGFYDMTARDCTLGIWGFRLTGQGPLNIERCEAYSDSFITLRSDYGSTWDGDARIVDCTHHYVRRDSSSQNLISVSASFDDAGKTQLHDFGYPTRHPNLHVTNLTVDEAYFEQLAGDYMPYRVKYAIVSNFTDSNNRTDLLPAQYWPDTVEVNGVDFVNYEDTIGYEPHLRVPLNEAGPVMEKAGNYQVNNVTYNGKAVAADVMDGVALLDEARDVKTSENDKRFTLRDFTSEKLGASDIAIEYSGAMPSLAMIDSNWKGWVEVWPYYVIQGAAGDETRVAYYSNAELVKRWTEAEGATWTDTTTGASGTVGPFSILEVRTGDGQTHVERMAQLTAHEAHLHNWGAWQTIEAPTCTEPGAQRRVCLDDARHLQNGEVEPLGHAFGAWEKLSSTQHRRVCARDETHQETASHTWNAGVVKKSPTATALGTRVYTCTACGATRSEQIADLSKATVSLSKASYVYDGTAKAPAVTVKLGETTLKKGTHYSVSYASGRKNVGAYKVTAKGSYKGSKSLTFKVLPKKTSLGSVKAAGKRGLAARWTRQATQTTGYRLQVSTTANFKKVTKTVKVANAKAISKKVTGLKASTKYWVRVCTYKKVGKATYCSAWSKVRSARTK